MPSGDFISFEQLDRVRQDVDRLMPGYYIQELDPIRALENGQGNCFTNAMIAGAHIANTFEVEASLAWSGRLHATERSESFGVARKSKTAGKSTDRNIAHAELLLPRGGDEFDVLGLGYGHEVVDNGTFVQEDKGGKIMNYNFPNLKPENTDVSQSDRAEDAEVKIAEGGEIVPTLYGRSLGMRSLDWQMGGTEYLAAVGLPEINYEELQQKVACFVAALYDGREKGVV